MPDVYQKYLGAIDWYAANINDEKIPDLRYAAAVLLLRYRDWPQARARLSQITDAYCGTKPEIGFKAYDALLKTYFIDFSVAGRGAAGLRPGAPADHRRPVHRIDLQQEPGGGALPGPHPADPHLGEVQGHHQAPGAGHRERGEGDRPPADRLPRGRRRHRHGHRHGRPHRRPRHRPARPGPRRPAGTGPRCRPRWTSAWRWT